MLELPVLENALPAAAGAFVPLALALRSSQRVMGWVSALTRTIPRTHYLIDIAIDFVRRDPAASLAVLAGLIFGRVARERVDRRCREARRQSEDRARIDASAQIASDRDVGSEPEPHGFVEHHPQLFESTWSASSHSSGARVVPEHATQARASGLRAWGGT